MGQPLTGILISDTSQHARNPCHGCALFVVKPNQVLGQPLMVIINDPSCIQHVLKENFEAYPKGATLRPDTPSSLTKVAVTRRSL